MATKIMHRLAAMNLWRPGPLWAAVVSGANLAFGVILAFSNGGPGFVIAGVFMLVTAIVVRLFTREQTSLPRERDPERQSPPSAVPSRPRS